MRLTMPSHRSVILFLFLASTSLFFQPATTSPHFNFDLDLDLYTQAKPPPHLETPKSTTTTTIIHNTTNQYPSPNPQKRQDGNPCEDGTPCDYAPYPWAPKKPYFVDPPNFLRCQPRPPPGQKFQDAHHRRAKEASGFFCHHFASSKEQDLSMAPIVKSVKVTGRPVEFWGIKLPPMVDDVEEWVEKEKEDGDEDGDGQKKKTDDIPPPLTDVYDFRVEVVEGCEPPKPDQFDDEEEREKKLRKKLNLAKPVIHNSCKHILFTAWKDCDNAGRGGSYQAGCFRYSIHTRF